METLLGPLHDAPEPRNSGPNGRFNPQLWPIPAGVPEPRYEVKDRYREISGNRVFDEPLKSPSGELFLTAKESLGAISYHASTTRQRL